MTAWLCWQKCANEPTNGSLLINSARYDSTTQSAEQDMKDRRLKILAHADKPVWQIEQLTGETARYIRQVMAAHNIPLVRDEERHKEQLRLAGQRGMERIRAKQSEPEQEQKGPPMRCHLSQQEIVQARQRVGMGAELAVVAGHFNVLPERLRRMINHYR